MTDNYYDIFGVFLFGLLIVSLIIDIFCTITWNKPYFTSGLVIFLKRISVNRRHTNIPTPALFEKTFQSNIVSSLVFKEIDFFSYGFREKMIQFRLIQYTPIMHGLITFDTDNNQIVVKGFVNWFAFTFFLISLIWSIMPIFFLAINWSIENIIFSLAMVLAPIVFLILIMGILYWIQFSRFSKIAFFAAESWARKYVRDNSRA